MTSCYDAGGERRKDGDPMDGVTNRARSDLELRVVDAMREHRRRAHLVDERHRSWKTAVAAAAPDETIADLREAYRVALFEAQAQQMVLASLVDGLGFVPVIDKGGVE